VLEAVQKRQHEPRPPRRRADPLEGLVELVRLHADEQEVDLLGELADRTRPRAQRSALPLERQPVARDRGRGLGPPHADDVAAGLLEAHREQPPDGAGAEHRDRAAHAFAGSETTFT
jgi:hypothetical protein